MVKIIGTKEEVQVIANMIHDTEYGACTYRTRNMQDNQFGVERCEDNIHLDFMVESNYTDKT